MRSLRTILAPSLAGLTLLVASHAHADEPVPAAPKGNPTGINEEARAHFAAGVSLLQDPEGEKVEEAYREFRTAYDVSGSPKILGNMGFCAMRLERDGEAIEAYSRYLREVPDIDAEERAQIVRDLQTLTVGVARLTIEVDKPGVRIIDVRQPVRGERITNTYGPVAGKLEIGVRPGHHTITAKLPDHDDTMWELDAFAASRDRFAFKMRPRAIAPVGGQTQSTPTNVGPWIVMGIGGAILIGGAVTGIIALGKTSDIESACPGDVCPKSFDLDGRRSSAKTFVHLTDALLIGGSVVTLGGLGWLLFGSSKSEKEPVKAEAGCGTDGCRASMKVVF